MEVTLEVIKHFRLVEIKDFEDLMIVEDIIMNEISDEEFLVVFYLGLSSKWGVNTDEKGRLFYCERPSKTTLTWVGWYLGYSKERVRQLIANIECRVYNAFYGTNFSFNKFLKFLAKKTKMEHAILREKVPQRYKELEAQGEKSIVKRLAVEFHISQSKVYYFLKCLDLKHRTC